MENDTRMREFLSGDPEGPVAADSPVYAPAFAAAAGVDAARARLEAARAITGGVTLRIAQLLHQLEVARQWYDEEYPPEEGRDQVYPWDHLLS
jgi:hypothetical protein